MYYVSPVTYLIGGTLSAVLADVPVVCSPDELVMYNPPGGQTCGSYSAEFLNNAIGYLVNPNATSNCQYCSLSTASGVPLFICCISDRTVHCDTQYLPESKVARFWDSAWIYGIELAFSVCHRLHLPLPWLVIYG